MPKFSSNFIIGGLISLLLAAAGVSWYITKPVQTSNLLLAQFTTCNQRPDNKDCLKLLAEQTTLPLPEVFKLIAKHEQEPALFSQCHTYLHFLGQFTLEKIGDISAVLRNGNSICFSGFYHGALEIYLQKHLGEVNETELQKLLPTICRPLEETSPKNFNECVHGLGHSLMFFADLQLPQALAWCDSLSDGGQRTSCYGGAFMENTTSSTNPDHPGKFLKADDPLYPCSILEDKYLASCYTLQGQYFVQNSGFDFMKAAKLCQSVPHNYQLICFNAIGQTIVGFTTNTQQLASICDTLPAEKQYTESCDFGVIRTLFERYDMPIDQAVVICETSAEHKQKSCKRSIVTSWQATNPASFDKETCIQKLRANAEICS